ncbi:hypothetical protein LCGC14_1165520 [marine sediment metagenome]|uniref:Phage head morphogenesis domain-containing protein n=1 Tax=marine sediment metagenome TaxID=412755 RepID=A0A0F9PWX4_9ZZZZ
MPTPPNFKPNPLTPQYLWNERAAQYSDRKSGRFVSRQVIRDQLDKVIDASSQVMRAVSQQLRDGNIGLAEWQLEMMQQIKTTHLAGGAMQRGGWQQMTQADFGRVGQIVRNEYGFLRNFAEQIAIGEQKLDGTLVRRASLYGQQGRPTYLTFWDSTAAQRGFDQERSILNPAEHCAECVSEAAKGFQPIGQMIPIGRRICRSNDRCDKEFRNSQTGETLRV